MTAVALRLPRRSLASLVVAALLVAAGSSGSVQRPASSALGSALPVPLQAAVSMTLGVEEGVFHIRRQGGLLVSRGGLRTTFTAAGATVRTGGGHLSLRLTGLGRGGSLASPERATLMAEANRVSYRRGNVSEWYLWAWSRASR
jgi:hypothetical protein